MAKGAGACGRLVRPEGSPAARSAYLPAVGTVDNGATRTPEPRVSQPAVPTPRFRVVIVAPVFRDWESATLLCRDLDAASARVPGAEVRILFVDDGSPDHLAGWAPSAPAHLHAVQALFLRRNLGHQRAIAVALCHVRERFECDAVLVMDADGEDRPEDAVTLIERAMASPSRIIFAERRKRLEGTVFRAGYHLYRGLHWILTGVAVRVGNFSILPAACLPRLTSMSELWNHYSGAVFKSKLPFDRIPMNRGRRYRGTSRMDLIALVMHGMSGIATFQDIAATRILLATVLVIAAVTGLLGAGLAAGLGASLQIPGWGLQAAGLLLVLLAQLLAISFSLVFILISSRNNLLFVPSRDHAVFIDRVETLCPAADGG